MLLMDVMDALAQIEERIEVAKTMIEHVPEYYEALKIAKASIEAQMELANILNDLSAATKEGDTFSRDCLLETLYQVWAGELPEEYKYIREDKG